MTRTQWRRFQHRKQAERQASVGQMDANKAGNQKQYKVKVDSYIKEWIKEFVSRPVVKCSEEATDNFESESEESLNILVNVVSILPVEYDFLTEVEDSADVDAEEMALHKTTYYFDE